ncbi:MAG: hypothetical protein DDT34_02547 [Firmicutes bacterium]|nr:hypothetical protein [Bacillota bacterium]
MGLWFLHENQVQWRAIVHRRPSSLGVENLHDHVDQIFESKPVITVRKGGSVFTITNLIVDTCVLAHDVGRV